MTSPPRKCAAIALLTAGLAALGVGAVLAQGESRPEKAGDDAAKAGESPTERLTLENGLTAFLKPVRGDNWLTTLVVLYSVGGDHDPAGRSGLSHLAEHIHLTAATGREKARTIEEYADRYPYGTRPRTSDRYTVFAASFLERDLDAALRDAASRMGDIRVTPEDLDRERPLVLEEVDTMYAGDLMVAALNNARELIRPAPGGGRRGGDAGALRALRARDVEDHLRRYYRPRNAVVVVSGTFDPDRARRLIREHFGDLAPGDPVPPPRPPGPPNFGAILEMTLKSPVPNALPAACLTYPAPTPESELYAPFLVLIERFRAGPGRSGARGHAILYDPLGDGAAATFLEQVEPNETPGQVIARLETYVAEMVGPELRDGEPAAALRKVGESFRTIPERKAASPYRTAFALGRLEQLKIDPARFNRAIEAVTGESLRKAAAEFFDPARHAAVFVKE